MLEICKRKRRCCAFKRAGKRGSVVAFKQRVQLRFLKRVKSGAPFWVRAQHNAASQHAHRRLRSQNKTVVFAYRKRFFKTNLRKRALVTFKAFLLVHQQHAPKHFLGAMSNAQARSRFQRAFFERCTVRDERIEAVGIGNAVRRCKNAARANVRCCNAC